MAKPDPGDQFLYEHARLLCDSFRHWTGRQLLVVSTQNALAAALFNAPFVLVSHNADRIPVFNYANRRALELFEMNWETFTRTPSMQSADETNQAARAGLMARVRREGCVTGCHGVRVTAGGRLFHIDDAIVWNVIDTGGLYHGQAAMFERWRYL